MNDFQLRLNDWRQRIAGAFALNPAKAWMLTILSTVLLVMIGRVIFTAHSVPVAQAGRVTPAAAPRSGWNPPGPASPSVPLAIWAHQPVEPMSRNLFYIPLDYFPYPDGAHPQTEAGGGLWDQLARSMSSQSDAKRQHQVLVDNLLRQAADLKLQGIVLGEVPMAWVNGSLLKIGDMIGSSGFRLVHIEARRIVVEREGVLLAIEMK